MNDLLQYRLQIGTYHSRYGICIRKTSGLQDHVKKFIDFIFDNFVYLNTTHTFRRIFMSVGNIFLSVVKIKLFLRRISTTIGRGIALANFFFIVSFCLSLVISSLDRLTHQEILHRSEFGRHSLIQELPQLTLFIISKNQSSNHRAKIVYGNKQDLKRVGHVMFFFFSNINTVLLIPILLWLMTFYVICHMS